MNYGITNIDMNKIKSSTIIQCIRNKQCFLQDLRSSFLLCFVVSNHANTKEDNGEDNLGEDTDSTGLGNESKEEAHGLPESVLREGSFLIRCKETDETNTQKFLVCISI